MKPSIRRLLDTLSILFFIIMYVGQAFGHAFLWCLILGINDPGWFWGCFTIYILPIGWWPEVGIIAWVKWVVTGNADLTEWEKIKTKKNYVNDDKLGALSLEEDE